MVKISQTLVEGLSLVSSPPKVRMIMPPLDIGIRVRFTTPISHIVHIIVAAFLVISPTSIFIFSTYMNAHKVVLIRNMRFIRVNFEVIKPLEDLLKLVLAIECILNR